MKRRHLLAAFASLAACRRSLKPRLNVFNWSDYAARDTVPAFERRHGVELRYAVYESNEEMLAKVFSGNSGWDIVFPASSLIGPMRENGLLSPIDRSQLPNLANLDPRFRHPPWDPQLEWCVPYMWGASGILYTRKLNPPPRRWADLWDPRLGGRITMLDDPPDAIGAALKKLGFPLNSTNPAELDAARAELLKQKPLVRAYLNAEARDQVVSGDLLAAQMWATTARQAMDAAPHLAFAYPEEGFSLYADCAVVLKESRRHELAHRFMNYLLEPETAAAVVTECLTATANAAAQRLLPPSLRDDPVLYPSPEVMNRGEWLQALPPAAQRLRDRIWTIVKSS
ncbi:MAG: spermidine/putrescine ABC transporter substrate-binding protein [Acidimicrobiia bacterium]|nr:spermidine/putrescine ABC transporter substrate-binding protein [Acidimicrobiia bacterium]